MFTKFANGAEQEIEEVYKYVNGAEQEAEAVYAYKNGAEVEVWSACGKLILQDDSDIPDAVELEALNNSYGKGVSLYAEELHDSAVAILAFEGSFTDPTISFDYGGVCGYYTSSGTEKYTYAGRIGLVTKKEDSSSSTTYITTTSGNNFVGDSDGYEEGSYSVTLSGTYESIKLRIELLALNTSGYTLSQTHAIDVYNIYVDG